MVANLFQYEEAKPKDGQQGGEEGNKIKRALSAFFVGKLNTESLNPRKVNSFKMLLFDLLPRSCRSSFTRTRFRLLQRTDHYRHFEAGQKDFKNEINIVKVLRDLRYYKAAVEKLMSEKPKKVRDEMNKKRNRLVKLTHTTTFDSREIDDWSDESHRLTTEEDDDFGQPG